MKAKRFKKTVSSAVSLFLIMAIVFTFSSSDVFAQDTVFTGIEAIEMEENQTVDLLQGISAVTPTGENLQVTVTDVICETDETYRYDGSGTLNTGQAGSVYRVEYQASSNENIYSASKTITVIPKDNISSEELGDIFVEENTENIMDDNIGEVTDESAEDITKEEEFSDENIDDVTSDAKGYPIIYDKDKDKHYIDDPEYPNERILLFCMNYNLKYPHYMPEMGEQQVPNYTEGYLTATDFKSQEEYQQCMKQLARVLYAGYPYNGRHLYKIVENMEMNKPSVEEFNKMLIVPPVLQTDFPVLGHHAFTYQDWQTQNKEHLDELRRFIEQAALTSKNNL